MSKTGWKSDRFDPRTGKERKRHMSGIFWRYDGSRWGFKVAGMSAIQGGYKTREDAVAARAKAQAGVVVGTPIMAVSKLTIGELAAEVLAAREKTVRYATFQADSTAWRILKTRVGITRVQSFTVQALSTLRDDLDGGEVTRKALAPASTDRYLSILREVLAEAVRRGIIERSPFERLKRRPRSQGKAKKYISDTATLEAILLAAEMRANREEARYDYAPIFATAALTGARIGEVLALRWSDVDLLEARIAFTGTLQRNGEIGAPKTAAGARGVGIPARLVDILVLHKPEDAEDEHFVFGSQRDPLKPLVYGNVRRRGWKEALRIAGLEDSGFTMHDLRHAAASLLHAQGHAIPAISKQLGHANAQVTMAVYSHAWGEEADDAELRFLRGDSTGGGGVEAASPLPPTGRRARVPFRRLGRRGRQGEVASVVVGASVIRSNGTVGLVVSAMTSTRTHEEARLIPPRMRSRCGTCGSPTAGRAVHRLGAVREGGEATRR